MTNVRSGSTLMETMLASHQSVWGLGEDSVFNSNLAAFRDNLVDTTVNGGSVQDVLLEHSEYIINAMKDLAEVEFSKTKGNKKHVDGLLKMTDKMLFNFRNIGTYMITIFLFTLLFRTSSFVLLFFCLLHVYCSLMFYYIHL